MDVNDRTLPNEIRMKILNKYDNMGKAERKLADTVLLLGNEIIHYNMADLAAESGVSEPSVIRFCKKLGYKGLKDFKTACIPLTPSTLKTSCCYSLEEVDSTESLVTFVVENMRDILSQCVDVIDTNAINKAIALIEKAHYIKVIGVGGSSIVARHAQHYLRMLGKHISIFSSHDPTDTLKENYNPNDVVLAISHSGRNQIIIDIAADAKEKGATIIGLTSWGDNKLNEISDVTLNTPLSGQGIINGYHALERVSQLAIVDVLFAGLYLKEKQRKENKKMKG